MQWPLGDAALLVLVAFYLGASQLIAAAVARTARAEVAV